MSGPQSRIHPCEAFGDPVSDVTAYRLHVISADVLYSALMYGEELEFAIGAVNRLVVALMRVLQRDLSIVCTVGYEEGNLDVGEVANKRDLRHERHEALHVRLPPDPHNVVPVVGYGPVALTRKTAALQFAPIVVCSPGDAKRETLFIGRRPW